MFLDQPPYLLRGDSQVHPQGCQKPLSGTRSSCLPTAEHRLPSTRHFLRTAANSLPRTPGPQLLHAEWGYVAPTLLLTWKCASWHLFFPSPNCFSLTVLSGHSADAISPVVRTGHYPELLQGLPAIFLWPWPIATRPGRAGHYGSIMDHSFPSQSNSLLLSCRFPLRICCDTLPSFWCEVAFHSFLWNLGLLLQFMPLIKNVLSGETYHSGEGSLLISKTKQVKCFS